MRPRDATWVKPAAFLGAAAALLLSGPTSAAAAGAPRPAALPALATVADDGLTRALRSGRISAATYALERARSLFRIRSVRRRYEDVAKPDPHDATLLLRDLRARVSQLSGEERRQAERILARPTDGGADPLGQGYDPGVTSTASCSANVCVHWVETTEDAPPGADGDPSTVPAWVDTTKLVLDDVWLREISGYGYRPPRSDASSPGNGGNGMLDVYLADIGTHGYYGYCTTDDPNANPAYGYGYYDVSAYCVLDDDFDPAQFPGASGLEALEVTAAHEFFHAVQYGYDWLEDIWLMEGTAAWMEDEVYDAIDDNRRFLASRSSLARPGVPLDYGRHGFEYGSWIFWRYLSERFGPAIVRNVWERVDGSVGGRDDYSLQAVKSAVAARGGSFRAILPDFAVANRLPALTYEEGAAYPPAPTAAAYTLTRRAPSTGWKYARLSHLASRYFTFRPGATVAPTAKLRIAFDVPALVRSPGATVLVYRSSGAVRIRRPTLAAAGEGSIVVDFRRGAVDRVDLVLSNGSTAFACWQRTLLSCAGLPLDDGRLYRFRARIG